MSKPIIKIVDVSTGDEVEREMTKSEYEQYLANRAKAQAEAQALAAKEAARQSALEKLAALGLTEAEIQALAG
jgi:phosphopantetheinyl transferase (holo-ACP synthase)